MARLEGEQTTTRLTYTRAVHTHFKHWCRKCFWSIVLKVPSSNWVIKSPVADGRECSLFAIVGGSFRNSELSQTRLTSIQPPRPRLSPAPVSLYVRSDRGVHFVGSMMRWKKQVVGVHLRTRRLPIERPNLHHDELPVSHNIHQDLARPPALPPLVDCPWIHWDTQPGELEGDFTYITSGERIRPLCRCCHAASFTIYPSSPPFSPLLFPRSELFIHPFRIRFSTHETFNLQFHRNSSPRAALHNHGPWSRTIEDDGLFPWSRLDGPTFMVPISSKINLQTSLGPSLDVLNQMWTKRNDHTHTKMWMYRIFLIYVQRCSFEKIQVWQFFCFFLLFVFLLPPEKYNLKFYFNNIYYVSMSWSSHVANHPNTHVVSYHKR